MSKSHNRTTTVLAGPGMILGAAVRSAGMSAEFFAPAKRDGTANGMRPQGRELTEGCPCCAVESMEMLRRIVSYGGASVCRNCRREARR